MAATVYQAGPRGTVVSIGSLKAVITTNENNNLLTAPGKLSSVIVWDVGTTATIDVYDHPSTNTGKVWGWVSADGKGVFALQMPMQNGLRVVTGGTFGGVTLVYEA